MHTVSETPNEDGNDKRTTCQTKLQRYRHLWNGDWKTTEEYTNDDTYEDGCDVWSVQTLLRVTHQFGNTVHILFWSDNHDTVTNVEVVVTTGKKFHTLACDTCHIDAIDRTKMHLSQCLSVHRTVCYDDASTDHWLWLVLFMPVNNYLRTNESLDGCSVTFGRNDENLIIHLEDSVTVWHLQLAFMHDTCADNVTVKEL